MRVLKETFSRPRLSTVLLLLSMASCWVPGITGVGRFPDNADSCADISRLDPHTSAIRCRFLPDDQLHCLIQLPDLEWLNFRDGWGLREAAITNAGLGELSQLHLEKLYALDIGECHLITDEGFAHISTMQKLDRLQALHCVGLSDKGLSYVSHMTNLTFLDIRRCTGITDEGLLQLTALTHLEELQIGGLEQVTQRGVNRLRAALPQTFIANEINWDGGVPPGPYVNKP
jgi:hypothetical protein